MFRAWLQSRWAWVSGCEFQDSLHNHFFHLIGSFYRTVLTITLDSAGTKPYIVLIPELNTVAANLETENASPLPAPLPRERHPVRRKQFRAARGKAGLGTESMRKSFSCTLVVEPDIFSYHV